MDDNGRLPFVSDANKYPRTTMVRRSSNCCKVARHGLFYYVI